MALCYNTTDEEQSIKIFGNWYAFKPGQIRNLNDNVAHFIETDRKETGIVTLPEQFDDSEYKASSEGMAELAARRQSGLKHYLDFHRKIVYNNQVSLRQDLERSNIHADPAVFASAGEMKSMEILAKYKAKEKDEEQLRIERVKELMKEAEGK
jgi:hypothetical protein